MRSCGGCTYGGPRRIRQRCVADKYCETFNLANQSSQCIEFGDRERSRLINATAYEIILAGFKFGEFSPQKSPIRQIKCALRENRDQIPVALRVPCVIKMRRRVYSHNEPCAYHTKVQCVIAFIFSISLARTTYCIIILMFEVRLCFYLHDKSCV